MNNMRLLTSIGGIDDDLIVRAGTDIMASQIKKDKKKTKPWIKASTIAACLALVLCFGYFSGLFGKLLDPEKPEFPDALENMIWAPHGSTSEIVDGFTEWNGLTVKMSLRDALEDTDNAGKYFAVVISKKDRSDMDSFVYNGKTYKALTDEIKQNKAEFDKLSELEKEGLLLCWAKRCTQPEFPRMYLLSAVRSGRGRFTMNASLIMGMNCCPNTFMKGNLRLLTSQRI